MALARSPRAVRKTSDHQNSASAFPPKSIKVTIKQMRRREDKREDVVRETLTRMVSCCGKERDDRGVGQCQTSHSPRYYKVVWYGPSEPR